MFVDQRTQQHGDDTRHQQTEDPQRHGRSRLAQRQGRANGLGNQMLVWHRFADAHDGPLPGRPASIQRPRAKGKPRSAGPGRINERHQSAA